MARIEYYHDKAAPTPNSLAPAAFAVVRDGVGRVLLVRRADTGDWELPGGRLDPGETILDAVRREVAEESAVTIAVTGISGLYSDPGHILYYPETGESRQVFAVCFHARPLAGQPAGDGRETVDAAWFELVQLRDLSIHPSMRLRITHAVTEPTRTHIE
ncbi:8-oxo-dGTP pyrophosphatase MutT (NUDIX family) [Pseudonocardia eucalypti]|uniref:NUDIX domain-containing protein n=1 Tax=Pseudonocardia eucalypti TaxID=648755 RepID=UPI001611E3AE|nr:8-oxo-dGTP pyrophosphatase MutT (NUDIX family) [Pseudonocardia eucalypti]